MSYYSTLPIEFFVAHTAIKRWLDQRSAHGSQHFNIILKERMDDDGFPTFSEISPTDETVSYVTLQAIPRNAGTEIVAVGCQQMIDDWAKKHAHQYPTQAQDIMELYYGRHRPAYSSYYSGPSGTASFSPRRTGKTAASPIKPIFPFPGPYYFASPASPSGVIWSGFDLCEPKPPLKTSAVIAGEIIGIRAWRVRKHIRQGRRPMIRSLYQEQVFWLPDQVMVGDVGEDGHYVGVHAYKRKSLAAKRLFREYLSGYLTEADYSDDYIIVGTVKLWGDVIEHEYGYRAQFAKVASLDRVESWRPPSNQNEVLGPIRALYGV